MRIRPGSIWQMGSLHFRISLHVVSDHKIKIVPIARFYTKIGAYD